jgi:hypothetical protein
VKLVDISGTERRYICQLKLMNLKQTVETRISEIFMGVRMTLRRGSGIELM